MAQQTAIDWLLENIQKVHKMDWDIVFIQAKAMEKEQITQSHLIGLLRPIEMEATKQAEQYYNETYNK
jgi:3-methyladenine DNA glycosylase AlkD